MARSGEVRVVNGKGATLISNNIPYGSFLKVKDGQKVEKGDMICNWDPYNAVILSETGMVYFVNLSYSISLLGINLSLKASL